MKIGIVTFYRTTNYGAMLQAYSLLKWLERMGHQVVIVRHPYGEVRRSSLPYCFKPCRKFPYLGDVRRRLSVYFSHPVSRFADRFPMGERADPYDALIVGSDQMWNPQWVLLRDGAMDTVFLGFAGAHVRRISYAVSFSVKSWGEERKDALKDYLGKFSAIGVRENSGKTIVDTALGHEAATVVVDPTLLWDRAFFEQLASDDLKMSDAYLFSYFISGTLDPVQERGLVGRVTSGVGLRQSVSNKDANVIGIGVKVPVAAWIGRIRNARFVLTDSFHGLVFAIHFHRPFAVMLLEGKSEGMNERVYTLLRLIGCEDRCFAYSKAEDACGILKKKVDWQRVDRALEKARAESYDFLAEALT